MWPSLVFCGSVSYFILLGCVVQVLSHFGILLQVVGFCSVVSVLYNQDQINWSVNNWLVNQSFDQSINHRWSIDQSINRSIDQSINQSLDQSINHRWSINQSINQFTRYKKFSHNGIGYQLEGCQLVFFSLKASTKIIRPTWTVPMPWENYSITCLKHPVYKETLLFLQKRKTGLQPPISPPLYLIVRSLGNLHVCLFWSKPRQVLLLHLILISWLYL